MKESPRADGAARLGIPELAERFEALTLLMYDTSVPLKTLKERVHPYLAEEIEFLDPVVRTRGRATFQVGLAGFHCVFPFDFVIFQLDVKLDPRGDRGRALVDGVMNLRTLPFYTYPLRTILVYDFLLAAGGTSFQITRQEEIWSFGDLMENAPVLARLYRAARMASGQFFTAFFWLGSVLSGGVTVKRRCAPAPRLPARYVSAARFYRVDS